MVARPRQPQKIFISHVSADAPFARKFAAKLQEEGFEPAYMGETYPGDNVFLKLGQDLEDADAIVFLLSPDAVQSDNLSIELGYVLGTARFEDRVIPVEIRETRSGIPWILKDFGVIRSTESPLTAARKVTRRLRAVASF